ncbi:hypothetical protein T06_13750, partial [Trichinella sp. T6]
LKTITLPRLEHMAALIAVKLVGFIKNSLAIPIQRIIFWTDSQIVFSWIRSEAKNWKPFVRNRVELIQQLTEPKLWKYCSSENNPADLISRGTSVTKLKNCRLWWEGPPSLLNPEPCEKTCEENTQHPDELEERCLFGRISLINDDQIEYNCRHASKERQEELTIEELNEAELYWMKPGENETFRDEESLLMEGHLQQSSLPYEHEHRVILQNKLNITDLTIRGEHKHQWHAGVEQTLAALRQRFWILKGRSIVKSDKYIYDLFRGDEKQKIARALTEEKIEWRFSCERSPWCGGYWERVLHAFCDASERAYGAVAYLRVETASGATRVNLVAAKTRVSPVKRLSLPRLEFMGALTAARLIRFAQRLPVLLERQRGHTCVGTVSAQSVEAIRPQSRRRDPTASGTSVLETLPGQEQPGQLTEPRIRGPSEHNSLLPSEEARVPQAALLVSVLTHTQDDVLHPGRYGDIERLFRITALCLRFARNCASATGERRRGPLTVQELDAAEQTWVPIAQRQGFRKEIDELRTSGDVAARSHLRPFSPCLDEAGTLRFGGRLEKSNLPLTEKHPAILPNEHEITPGLILRCHLRQLHAGVPDPSHATTALLGPAGAQSREAYYPQLSQCRWATARPTRPRMAALPDVRTTLAPAFAHVGMDFAGPLFVKTTRKTTSPRYVCLITCMVSRAVHLELVSEMSTVGVVQALRHFIARRGRPATIQTDNFRSFQSAASELRRLWRGIDV